MSKEPDILILEASPTELRLSRAVVDRDTVRFLNAQTIRAKVRKEDGSALGDQHAVDSLAAYVTENKWNGKDVLCLLSGSAISCHYFDMPPLKGNSLKQAVHLKLGQQLHFPVDAALVNISPLASRKTPDGEQLRVAATAIRRSVINAVVQTCNRLETPLMMLSAAQSAMTALATSAIIDACEMQALLHVGDDTSTLIILQDGRPCITNEIEIGGRDFASALTRPIIDGDNVIQLDEKKAIALRDDVGIPQADQQIESLGIAGGRLLPLLEPILQKLSLQLTQWMSFAATSADGKKVSHLKLVGPGAEIPGLAQAVGIRIGVTASERNWLEGLACIDSSVDGMTLSSFAAATSAVLHQRDLPDLLPRNVRQHRRVLKVRRSATLVTPIAAAAILGVGFLFDAVATKVAPSLGAEQAKLAHLQRLENDHNQWSAVQRLVAELQKRLDEFSRATPRWDGLFKELSRTLPPELQITDILARSETDAMFLTLRTRIFTSDNGRSFDETLEETLMSLELSPFFRRVQPLGSNRLERDGASGVAGTMDVELELAFPKPRTGA